VRDLPEQEVADAHLAARANQQIRIGLARRVENSPNRRSSSFGRRDAGSLSAARGIDNLGPAAVVQRMLKRMPVLVEVRRTAAWSSSCTSGGSSRRGR
jgi:hypothetical protein